MGNVQNYHIENIINIICSFPHPESLFSLSLRLECFVGFDETLP